MLTKNTTLTLLILSQFLCTSLWFASNGCMPELINAYQLPVTALGSLTSAVQFGFIAGTFLLAIFYITDKFSPSKLFLIAALLGSLSNLAILLPSNSYLSLLAFRFFTGLALAGIYPVGMKIAADYFDKKLGKALGWLVGALVLGTAFPHFLSVFFSNIDWQWVLIATSILATTGGLIVWRFIPDGPYRSANSKPNFKNITHLFRNKKLKTAAAGYFGHMWELYAFWTFLPSIIILYKQTHPTNINTSLLAFLIISSGSLACIAGAYLAAKTSLKKAAHLFLIASGSCCLLLPVFFYLPVYYFIPFLFFWGMVVIADSPLFSTLVANSMDAKQKGTALTLVNCIGFSLTIVSIQLLNFTGTSSIFVFLILAVGPIFGLYNGLKKSALK
ncbi:MFS transporter [Flavicella sediminum]|uniref:MFS transporter n=1 Tax=Flavicella sediminum TaxID=2585141 RepID=UPI001120BA49|nr:MFS transporter [Flavicella sediminum]